MHRYGEQYALTWRDLTSFHIYDKVFFYEVVLMTTLKKNYLIKKRNVLNELRANNMELQELRFFSIYLSKINSSDPSTRVVRFPIDDFKAIMELVRIDINYIKNVTNRLLSKVVNIPDEYGGYIGFQLFKRCRVSIDDNGEWFVEINAHDESLPLMFEFKEKYFTYQLWNALRLKSSNQLRMYEILKQYEKIGSRILSIPELKDLLGIDKNDYPFYADFRRYVVDVCKQALLENTDIKFTYEPYGKRGKSGKILYLRFFIQKNDTYIDQLSLPEFIQQNKTIINNYIDYNDYENDFFDYEKKMLFLSDACDNEFSISELKVLHDKMIVSLPYDTVKNELECYNYLMRKYRYMNMQHEKNKIRNRFKYMESIIGIT